MSCERSVYKRISVLGSARTGSIYARKSYGQWSPGAVRFFQTPFSESGNYPEFYLCPKFAKLLENADGFVVRRLRTASMRGARN